MPDFHLTDQRGKPMTLAEFRGRAVVLMFNDDRCKDLCTLLAEDVIAADHDLGLHQNKIAFVSINANSYYPSVSDVGAWTNSHGLKDVNNWYFGTGTPQQLDQVASAYEVAVTHNVAEKTVEHGAEVFYIDPHGREVGTGGFGDTSANTALYGHDMAQLAMSMLPTSERHSVRGKTGQPARSSGALGSTPSPISIPSLRGGGTVSTEPHRDVYTVVNFWSSSCTACVTELPGFESMHRMYGRAVDFLGVDVADNPSLGIALADKTKIDYPIADDRTGKVSGAFEVADLPFTIVLDSSGKIVIRHLGFLRPRNSHTCLKVLNPRCRSSRRPRAENTIHARRVACMQRYTRCIMSGLNHAAVQVVEDILAKHGMEITTKWFDESTSTAVEAADALGVALGAIVKSLVFMLNDEVILILASGAHRVDTEALGQQLGGKLSRAKPDAVKEATGQTIGGVSPIGHPHPLRTVIDETLAGYDLLWAAAGHPRAVFSTSYRELLTLTNGIPVSVVVPSPPYDAGV